MPDALLPSEPLRTRLRAATAQAHARLDGLMARGVSTRADYRAYLRGMHAFVASLVPTVAAWGGARRWSLPDWEGRIEQDLRWLEDAAPRLQPERLAQRHGDAALGALYVLEGSALGARLLLRDAQALGFGPDRGAAFLAGHAGDGQRWQRFVALLAAPDATRDDTAACNAACDTFELAERCFRRALETAA